MGLSCPLAVVSLFILELNSTLKSGGNLQPNIPIENETLVISGGLSEGSLINLSFSVDTIWYVQQDPAYNRFFGLSNKTGNLYSKETVNISQSNASYVGTFLMAVSKDSNQSSVDTLYCVTYCVGNANEACRDSKLLLSQHSYQANVTHNIPPGYAVLQLALQTSSVHNISNVSFAVLTCNSLGLFFVDHLGTLRTRRNLVADEATYHFVEISVTAKDSGRSQLVELASVTVDLSGCLDPPLFEDPSFKFSVREGESGLTVGFIKAVDRHTGLSESISYSFKNEHSKYLFDLNQISGEIKTARALDRETADFHQFTVVASLHFLNGSYNSYAEVLVTVEDINDNPPVLAKEEYTISLSLHAKPGLLLNLNASDKDIGENAEVAFEITDGNKKQLFWINSSSGDLFLVAPITFTEGDVVVLVVEARDASTTNALRDTTIVRVSFYGDAKRSSALTAVGSSVGTVVFIIVLAVVALLLWKRRKKRYLRGTSDHLQMEDVKRTCSGMNSAVVTSCTPRSPMELSGTFSSESQSPTISTKLRKMDSQVRLVEGCQVVVELCHMEPELLSSLQPTEQVSEIEPRAFISTPVGVDLCHMDPDPSLRLSDVYSPIGSATDVTFNRCNDLDTSLSDTWGKSVSSLTPRSLRNLWLGYESEPSAVSIRKLANEPLSSHSEDPQVSMDHSYREHDSSSTVNWPPQFYEMEPSSPLSTPASGFSDPDSLFGSVTDVTLNYGNASDTSLDETEFKSVSSFTPGFIRNLWRGFSCENEPPAVPIRDMNRQSPLSSANASQVNFNRINKEPDLPPSTAQCSAPLYESEPSPTLLPPASRINDLDSPVGSVTDVKLNYSNASDTSLDETEFKSVSSFTPGFIRNLWRGLSCENEPPAVPIRDMNRQSPLSSANASQVNFNRINKEPDLPPSTAQCSALLYESEPSPTLSPPASRISDLDSPVGSVTDVKLNYSNASDTSLDETEFKSVSSFTPGSLRNLWRGLSCENEPSAVPTRDITKETPPSSVKVARISRDQCYMQADSPSNVQCSTKMFEMEASSPSAPASRFGDAELPVVKVIDPTSKYSNDLDKTSSETEIESVSSLTPESLRNLWRGLSYENKPQATSIRDSTRESSSSLFKVSQVEYPTSPSTVTSNVADLLSDSLSDVAINYPPSSRNVSLNSMSSVSVFLGNLSTRSRISNRTEIGEHSSRSTGASELTLLQRILSALRAPFRPYETAESTINVQSNDRRAPSQSSHPDGTL